MTGFTKLHGNLSKSYFKSQKNISRLLGEFAEDNLFSS